MRFPFVLSWRPAVLVWWIFMISASAQAQSFTIPETQIDIAVVPGCDHVPIEIPVTAVNNAAVDNLQVTSDQTWATPSVDANGTVAVELNTRALVSSTTATITLSLGSQTTSVFLSATIAPLKVYRLVDDPFRNLVYGIQLVGANAGAVFTYDPQTGTKGVCATVGKRPTDMEISPDGSELLVICSADEAISVIDLATFTLKETISLPIYDSWGTPTDTTANIGLGAGDIIYYTDGSWGPIMRVFNRSTGEVIQSITFNGGVPTNTTGFQDFAITPDKTRMVAMPQYGWSAGGHTPVIAHYNILSDGRLAYQATSTVTTGLQREPFEAPALVSADGETVFLKTIAVTPDDINEIQRSFSSAVWSISRGGEWVATATAIYDFSTGNQLLSIPNATSSLSGYTDTKAQAFTADYSRFVYFNPSSATLHTLDLQELIGVAPDGSTYSPARGAVVTQPDKLTWAPRLSASQYNVYLGESADAIEAASTSSPEYLTTTNSPELVLDAPLTPGRTYFWRVDPVFSQGPQKGPVHSFTVSAIGIDQSSLELRGVSGTGSYEVTVALTSDLEEPWTASSDQEWITFAEDQGTAPGSLTVLLNSDQLPPGVALGSVTLSTSSGDLNLPVELLLEPMRLTKIKSDPNSSTLYAISEVTGTPGAKAYLLEIDAETESVLRSVEVGTSATDLAIHAGDNTIYVTNWLGGSLLAINRDTFELRRTYPFSPFGGMGYGENDVYLVSAGVSGRLMVEENDQWIRIRLFDTRTGTQLSNQSLREGGGSFDSTGRYYYHGENNSSGATILKYDVTGDAFTQLAEIRPDGISYYGSRTVVVSEDDQRIFWAGVVLDAALNPEWTIGETVYSCTADGRFAFAENRIYDIARRVRTLGMPVSTKVSAFNSTSGKLVTQGPSGLQFHRLTLPITLGTPVLIQPGWDGSILTVRWEDHSLETAFHLQRRNAGSSTWVDVSSAIGQNETSFAVSGLNDMARYEFRVRAFAPEHSSAWSEPFTVDLIELPPPAPRITRLIANSPSSVSLNWVTVGTTSSVILERSNASSEDWEVVATLPGDILTYRDEGLLANTSYLYRLRSTKAETTSPSSLEVMVTTPPLLPPNRPAFDRIITPSFDRVTLSWTDLSNESGYRIERKLQSSTEWQEIANIPADSTTFSDTTVEPLTQYSYQLFAYNDMGSSAASNPIQITTLARPEPTVPGNVAVQAQTGTSIVLAWSDSENEYGYRIYRNIGEGDWLLVTELPPDTTSYLDDSVNYGGNYNYRIVAFNPTVEVSSQEINVVAAITGSLLTDTFDPELDISVWSGLLGAQVTGGPQGFYSGNALWFGGVGQRVATTVGADLTNGGNLHFQFRAGNQTADGSTHWDNSEDNENVIVEYSTAGGEWQFLALLGTKYPDHNAWTEYSITVPLAARTEATRFRWRQQSNSGAAFDTWALDDVEIRGVLPPPPGPPSFILASANSARAAAITWATSAEARHYVIQRRTPSTDWIEVGSAPGYEQFFTDQTVTPATAYSYRVVAVGPGGDSTPSQHAFVTTWSILQEWRFQNFGTASNTGNAGDLEENDTGVSNLLKFAFNMAKDDQFMIVEPDGDKGLPFATAEGDLLQIAFIRHRNPDHAGIEYIVEFTSNLSDWNPGGIEVLAEPINEDYEFVIWRDTTPMRSSGIRVARIRVVSNH